MCFKELRHLFLAQSCSFVNCFCGKLRNIFQASDLFPKNSHLSTCNNLTSVSSISAVCIIWIDAIVVGASFLQLVGGLHRLVCCTRHEGANNRLETSHVLSSKSTARDRPTSFGQKIADASLQSLQLTAGMPFLTANAREMDATQDCRLTRGRLHTD